MKIGIIKLGANITQNTSIKTASNTDIFSLLKLIDVEDNSIHIITNVTRNTEIHKPYKLHNLAKIKPDCKGLDILLVFNGPINFFAGKEDFSLLKQYAILREFKGKIFYTMTDCRFPLENLWQKVRLKEWSSKYSQEELDINRSDINYLYQGRDHNKLINAIAKKKKLVDINSDNIYSFPIEWANIYNLDDTEYEKYSNQWFDKPRKYDLIYGGSNRDANRKNMMQKYYVLNQYELSVEIFGSIKLNNYENVTGTIPHYAFLNYMRNGLATVIVGDKFYNDNFFTLRMYESILAGCVMFIDRSFDREQIFYDLHNANNNDDLTILNNFLYVDTTIEVQDKIQELKSDRDFYESILKLQLSYIRSQYIKLQYKQNFNKILGINND